MTGLMALLKYHRQVAKMKTWKDERNFMLALIVYLQISLREEFIVYFNDFARSIDRLTWLSEAKVMRYLICAFEI